jgi:hypothetical protein
MAPFMERTMPITKAWLQAPPALGTENEIGLDRIAAVGAGPRPGFPPGAVILPGGLRPGAEAAAALASPELVAAFYGKQGDEKEAEVMIPAHAAAGGQSAEGT